MPINFIIGGIVPILKGIVAQGNEGALPRLAQQALPQGPRSGHTRSPLTLRGVERGPGQPEGTEDLRLLTDAGSIPCRLHPAPGDRAVLWVFGAGGGLGGPAGGLYSRLGHKLRAEGIAS